MSASSVMLCPRLVRARHAEPPLTAHTSRPSRASTLPVMPGSRTITSGMGSRAMEPSLPLGGGRMLIAGAFGRHRPFGGWPLREWAGDNAGVVGKRALLIGIDRYPNFPEGNQLHGCVNDVEAMAALLRDRFGFPEDAVAVLRDEAATQQGIRDAVD